MLEIKITGDTPLEALASLTAFGIHCMQNQDVVAAANHILEAEQHKASATATVAPAPAPTPAPTPTQGNPETPGPATTANGQTAPPSDPAPVPPSVSSDDAPAAPKPQDGTPQPPTVAKVRERGIEASRKHGKDAIVAILKQFGVSGMSALAEKDRAAFIAKLDELDTAQEGDANA